MTKRNPETVAKLHLSIVKKVVKGPRSASEIATAAGIDPADKIAMRDVSLALRGALSAGTIVKPGAQRGRTVVYAKAA